MNLEDKARDSPDVDLARQSAPGAYRMLTTDLEAANDLTPDGDFPQFGDFLKVERVGSDGTEKYIECPAALARWLVHEADASPGFCFRIRSVQKIDGEWQYKCEDITDEIDEVEDGMTLSEAAGDD